MLRRLCTFTLWTGTLLCVLIAVAFVVSARWRVWVAVPGGPCIGVNAGGLGCYSSTLASRPGYLPHGDGLRFALIGMTRVNGFTLPLVYPFATVAIPTFLVWWFWPKPIKPGHCRCGYDLTGNTSGVCPECGEPMVRKGDAQ